MLYDYLSHFVSMFFHPSCPPPPPLPRGRRPKLPRRWPGWFDCRSTGLYAWKRWPFAVGMVGYGWNMLEQRLMWLYHGYITMLLMGNNDGNNLVILVLSHLNIFKWPCSSHQMVSFHGASSFKWSYFSWWMFRLTLGCHGDVRWVYNLFVPVFCLVHEGIVIWLVVWNFNFIFPYIGNNHPNWLIFFRGVETTNQ